MRIVVVDNNPNSTGFFISCLKEIEENIEYHVFQDGDQALDYIKSHPIDMLFTEVRLRTMSGFALINRVKSLCPWVYTVILTKTQEYAVEAWANHADDYIVKASLSEYLDQSIWYVKNRGFRK